MDLNKLQQDLVNKEFTDAELIIVDPNEKINISIHKIVLASSSDYFRKLFTFGDGKNKSTYEIIVDDAKVSHDIIYSFYGIKINSPNYPEWKYILKIFICRNFFCLANDVYLLYNLIVPADGFDLMLETMGLFDYINDLKLMKTIKNNFPDDYDLNKLSIDFIKKIIDTHNCIIVSGDDNCCIKIWDAETGKLLRTLNGHTNIINSVALSTDNIKIVSGSDDRSIKIWDIESGDLLSTLFDPSTTNNGWIHSVAFSPATVSKGRAAPFGYADNLKIVSGNGDHSIKIWDAQSGKLLRTLNGHTEWVNSVAFSYDNHKIVSGSHDRSIKIWDSESGKLLHTLTGHTSAIWSVAFLHDNMKIVSGSADCSIKIWDTESGKLLRTLKDHTCAVRSISISSDDLKIVSGSCDKSIKIWDTESGGFPARGNLLCTLNGHISGVKSVAFSPDNLKIVSCSYNSIKIWDVESGNLLHNLNPNESSKATDGFHTGMIRSVACQQIFVNLNKKLINYLNNHKS
jgi:WD40 repeat protein